MKDMHKSPFKHDYPKASGVTSGASEAGKSVWKHPYPAAETKSDHQGAPGPTPWMHPYPKHQNPASAHRKSLRHFMKKHKKEGY